FISWNVYDSFKEISFAFILRQLYIKPLSIARRRKASYSASRRTITHLTVFQCKIQRLCNTINKNRHKKKRVPPVLLRNTRLLVFNWMILSKCNAINLRFYLVFIFYKRLQSLPLRLF